MATIGTIAVLDPKCELLWPCETCGRRGAFVRLDSYGDTITVNCLSCSGLTRADKKRVKRAREALR